MKNPTVKSGAVSGSGGLLWIVGFWLLLLASNPLFLTDSSPLMDVPDRGLLGEGKAWNPPLAALLESQGFTNIPFWLGTALIACLLGFAARRQHTLGMPWLLVLIGAVGLTQVETHSTIVLPVLLWLVGVTAAWSKRAENQTQVWQTFAISIAILVAGMLSSLEFGLVIASLSFVAVLPALYKLNSAGRQQKAGIQRESRVGTAESRISVAVMAAIWFALVAIPLWLVNGMAGASLRPISWLWLRPPTDLLPSMTLTWRATDFDWKHGMAILLVLECWRKVSLGRVRLSDVLLLAIFSLIALGCARYFWMAVAAIFLCCWPRQAIELQKSAKPERSKMDRQASRMMVALGVLMFLWQAATNASTILAADIINRDLDVRQWNVTGTVMLTNLEQAAEWQHASLQADTVRYQYQPVLTDRWDIYHAEYARYAATCADWKNWKREAYLRSEGDWGGYQSVFSKWQPVLVVVDSRDLAGIHRVSLDSHWKIIGIDHRKTVFASSASPSTEPYVSYANQCLSTLEFPRPISDVDFERVLALGNPADARQVSAVLTSLRLPFAALRVLPRDTDRRTDTCAKFAYAELAHRSHRYSGNFSLLDNVRALAGPANLYGDKYIVERAQVYRLKLENQIAEALSSRIEADETDEQRLRESVLLGRPASIRLGESIPGGTAAGLFYESLDVASQPTAETLIARLQAVRTENLTPMLAAECSFYIGCLANEIGDVGLAQNALAESLQVPIDSPFAPIAAFYLSQIQD